MVFQRKIDTKGRLTIKLQKFKTHHIGQYPQKYTSFVKSLHGSTLIDRASHYISVDAVDYDTDGTVAVHYFQRV